LTPDKNSTGNIPAVEPRSHSKACVSVRMYRLGGLGDCFLLTFYSPSREPFYMLIDCGIFIATPGGAARMRTVVGDIIRETGGHIHVLVATHEHWDHTSGVRYAKKLFDEIKFDQVWLAWTEDPENSLAQELRQKRNQALKILNIAANKLREGEDPQGSLIRRLLGFEGYYSLSLGVSSTASQMEYIQERSEDVRYLTPGDEPVFLEDVPGVRIFVLGPPENVELLTRSNPSTSSSEVYERGLALNSTASFFAAALAAGPGELSTATDKDVFERSAPFDSTNAISISKAADHEHFGKFFRSYYGWSMDDPGAKWRRIDSAWLGAASDVALALNNDTNNTSLVLAIELLPSKKVLLFPGDAQVGNWLSWHSRPWPDGEDGAVEGDDLLKRTVLYKTGHHGSHNATLREKGLEMMTSPELVAMIPVDEDQAKAKSWEMPFQVLLTTLEKKTRGRVLRADRGIPKRPRGMRKKEWERFVANVNEDQSEEKLWIEYRIEG
jgi:beta-lactamase superfamily II metal-dependent hydrolase